MIASYMAFCSGDIALGERGGKRGAGVCAEADMVAGITAAASRHASKMELRIVVVLPIGHHAPQTRRGRSG